MNGIRSLLLHLDSTPASAARLDFARDLALRHEAASSAMYVAAPAAPSVQLAFSESPAALLQPTDRGALEHTKAWFDNIVASGGPATRLLDTGSADPVSAFAIKPCTPTCWCWGSAIRPVPGRARLRRASPSPSCSRRGSRR
jgi:hypothetical protein